MVSKEDRQQPGKEWGDHILLLTFILWFVIKRQRFRTALDAQNTSGVASICLQIDALIMWGEGEGGRGVRG